MNTKVFDIDYGGEYKSGRNLMEFKDGMLYAWSPADSSIHTRNVEFQLKHSKEHPIQMESDTGDKPLNLHIKCETTDANRPMTLQIPVNTAAQMQCRDDVHEWLSKTRKTVENFMKSREEAEIKHSLEAQAKKLKRLSFKPLSQYSQPRPQPEKLCSCPLNCDTKFSLEQKKSLHEQFCNKFSHFQQNVFIQRHLKIRSQGLEDKGKRNTCIYIAPTIGSAKESNRLLPYKEKHNNARLRVRYGYTSGPVPAPPAMNNPASYPGNGYPSVYAPGFANNCPFPPPVGANTGANNSMNRDVNALSTVPPPGYSPGAANSLPTHGAGGTFPSTGFARPPSFGAPPFPRFPAPFPNSTYVQPNTAYSGYQVANVAYPPPYFNIPPPRIPYPPRYATYSKFRWPNARPRWATPKTKNMPFHCESCDRDFLTEARRRQHISEHVICGIDGCAFSAHMKIVENHISSQHSTGLFNRIVRGNSPEEIAKWIADRKREFPTQERKIQKQAQEEEMIKRGECYSEPRKKFNNRFSNVNRRHNGCNKSDNSRRFPSNRRMYKSNASETSSQDQSLTNRERRPRRRREVVIKDDENDDDCCIRKLAPFRGTVYYLDADDDDETDSTEKNDSTIGSDAVSGEPPVFDVFDSDTESNDATYNTSPAASEISLNEVTTTSSTSIRCDSDDYDSDVRCLSPVLCQDESSLSKSSFLDNEDVTTKSIDFLGLNRDGESAENDFSNSPEISDEEVEAETDVSCVNSSQNCSVSVSPSVPTTSHSLDLLKAYDFSDDEDESDEIVETTKMSPKIVAPSNIQSSDDSEPEECSSKIGPSVESVVSSEKLVPNEAKSNVEESDSKRSRKRRRRKDSVSREEPVNEKKAKEADNQKLNVPDLIMHHQKRNRPPTLLEKLLANEIKHERNVILQCVRYVVQNNYFDIGQTKGNK